MTKSDYDKAIADFPQASDLLLNDPRPFRQRAVAYIKKEDWAKARVDYDNLIALNPTDAAGIQVPRLRQRVRREDTKALADYDKAIQLNPNDATAYIDRGNLYAQLTTSTRQRPTTKRSWI